MKIIGKQEDTEFVVKSRDSNVTARNSYNIGVVLSELEYMYISFIMQALLNRHAGTRTFVGTIWDADFTMTREDLLKLKEEFINPEDI